LSHVNHSYPESLFLKLSSGPLVCAIYCAKEVLGERANIIVTLTRRISFVNAGTPINQKKPL